MVFLYHKFATDIAKVICTVATNTEAHCEAQNSKNVPCKIQVMCITYVICILRMLYIMCSGREELDGGGGNFTQWKRWAC